MDNKEGSSVKIYRVEKFDIKKEAILPLQRDMTETTNGTGTLKNSYTKITLTRGSKTHDLFSVEQYTKTIHEPIRFYWEGIRDFDHGYQKLARFEIIHRKSDALLFLFVNNFQTDLLMGRLKELTKNQTVKLDAKEFDFTMIRSIPQVKTIWGVWERVYQAHKSANASFGVDVDMNIEVNLGNATALNIKMEVDKKIYTITLSKEGRISSKNVIKHDELIRIFDDYFASMLK